MTHEHKLNIEDGGQGGIPVVFVHSAAGSIEQWRAQLEHLRPRGHRAIAVDLRGHGRSPPPIDGDFSIAALASDVVAAADGLGIERFVLVGHCMGGAAAVEVAGHHPDRVAGLLLLDPASDGRAMPEEQKKGLMASLRGDAYLATVEAHWSSMIQPSSDAVRQFVLDELRRTPRETVVGTLGALLDFDPVTPLRRYRGPRLSIATELNDTPEAYHALVPDLPHRKVAGVGHWLQLDDPDHINVLIDEFLRAAAQEAGGPRVRTNRGTHPGSRP